MKTIAWIFGIIGALLMLFGLICFLVSGNFLGVKHAANFFHVANSCLLLAILCKCCCHHHKEECKKE